jgi:competence protein ComEA
VGDDQPTTDPDPFAGPHGAGVHVLEDLVRDGPPVRRARPARTAWRPGQPFPAPAVALVAAAVLVAAVVGVVWFRRSGPVDQQLPMTAASGPVAAAGGQGGPGSGPGDGGAAALPVASSSTVPAGPLVVHVAGAVVRPGVVTVPGGSRVADALAAAGGLRTDADPDRLNLAAVLRDGERVAVPVAGQPAPVLAEGGGGSAGGPGGTGGGSGDDKVVGTVDLNTATEAELEGLPGVGPSTAAAIVEHRTSSGPFRSVEDLLDVRGIGDAKLEQLRARVTVG